MTEFLTILQKAPQDERMSLQRVLLCRPRGGLNDTLCQIERCFLYATQYGRLLIIDARRSFFHGELSAYLQLRKPMSGVILDLEDDVALKLEGLSCRPGQVTGRLSSYATDWSADIDGFADTQSGAPLTFDFSADHSEAVLVHEQCGGGSRSLDMIGRLTMSSGIREEIGLRLSHLGGDYAAVHVRNTDLTSDYRQAFENIEGLVQSQKLLVCSDDARVIEYARSRFKSTIILQSSQIPDTSGRPLHEYSTFTDPAIRQQSVRDALVDLIALASAQRLVVVKTNKNRPSGFSLLASYLFKNPDILHNLLLAPLGSA
jgi:hypothetical protein